MDTIKEVIILCLFILLLIVVFVSDKGSDQPDTSENTETDQLCIVNGSVKLFERNGTYWIGVIGCDDHTYTLNSNILVCADSISASLYVPRGI